VKKDTIGGQGIHRIFSVSEGGLLNAHLIHKEEKKPPGVNHLKEKGKGGRGKEDYRSPFTLQGKEEEYNLQATVDGVVGTWKGGNSLKPRKQRESTRVQILEGRETEARSSPEI